MDRIRQRQLQKIKQINQEQCATNCRGTAPLPQGIRGQSTPISANHNVEILGENRITYYPPVFV